MAEVNRYPHMSNRQNTIYTFLCINVNNGIMGVDNPNNISPSYALGKWHMVMHGNLVLI